ncbi:hypothetical protein PybrP1_005916 [[Pythium] brassicae (nom. inval.)]|nr:hypothetical protein PybrP1_005916 [[Pythium] brassicae (nom. inval.)]
MVAAHHQHEQQQPQLTSPARGAAPAANATQMIHTRSCNGREVCSCILRLQSAYFQKNLVAKTRKKPASATPEASPAKKPRRAAYRPVKNLQRFDTQVKQLIAVFLQPAELARLSMVNKAMREEAETIAMRGTKEFVAAPSRAEFLLKDSKQEHESWARYLHVQMNCVHRLLVYYTGYRTGQMRRDYAHWTFGVVEIDPNDPSLVVLPNTWKFHEHEPWVRKRANGKDGEWLLRDAYKRNRAPKQFGRQVKEWASTLRPGSFVAVAYQNAGSEETAWWEAQVWHVWRAQEQPDPVTVYDAENDANLQVLPTDLLEHFKQNPLHVIDVCSTPRKLCTRCAHRGHSFFFCHVERGHPMQ